MAEITQAELAQAVENVRHRALQKRVDRRDADVPKNVKTNGIDWEPCGVCNDDAKEIIKELARLRR